MNYCLISRYLTQVQCQEFVSAKHQTLIHLCVSFKNSKYDQKIPQSQTAEKPMASRGRATQPSRDTRKTN